MRPIYSALIAALLILLPESGHAQDVPSTPAAGQYEIRYEDGLVTVHSNEADAESVLRDFSEKSGITFNKFAAKSPRVTLNLERATVDEFLNRMLGSYVAKSKKVDGAIRISAVTVMDEGPDSSPPPELPPPVEGQPPSEGHAPPPPGEEREEIEHMPQRERRKRAFRKRRLRGMRPTPEQPPEQSEGGEQSEPPPDPETPPQ